MGMKQYQEKPEGVIYDLHILSPLTMSLEVSLSECLF